RLPWADLLGLVLCDVHLCISPGGEFRIQILGIAAEPTSSGSALRPLRALRIRRGRSPPNGGLHWGRKQHIVLSSDMGPQLGRLRGEVCLLHIFRNRWSSLRQYLLYVPRGVYCFILYFNILLCGIV